MPILGLDFVIFRKLLRFFYFWRYHFKCSSNINLFSIKYNNQVNLVLSLRNTGIIGSSTVTGRVLWLKVCPTFRPLLFGGFLGIGSFVFSENQYGVKGPCVAVWGRARFFEKKNVLLQKWGKWAKNRGFFNLMGNLLNGFYLNLIYKKNLYYLLYSCAKPILGKNLVPEILAKMLLTNQIVKFLNWLCLLNKIMTFCMSMQIHRN